MGTEDRGRPDPLPLPASWICLSLDLFSPPVFSLQSPRASCLPSLQACSRCGPPWAPSRLSHLPRAQERLRPLRPPVQVSPLEPHQPGDGSKGSRGPSTLADFLFLLFSCPFSAQWSSHNHSRCCRLCSLLPDTTVWMLANFFKHNAEKIALFWKSPLDRDGLNPAWFLESVPPSPPLPTTPGFLIFQSPLTLSFLVGHI